MAIDNVYLGNPNLKKANTQIEFTQEQILEFVACRHDPVYFAKKYIKIVSLDHLMKVLSILISIRFKKN